MVIEHGNTFHQNVQNVGKLGAYYTDLEHCRRLGRLIDFPKEFCCLEPSIGDGSAILEVLGESRVNSSLYGVELNRDTFISTKESGVADYLINADFLKGIKVSQKVFSFCYANPPYGEYEDGMRLEQAFCEKMFLYLKKDALLLLVIPHYVLTDERFSKSFFARYNPVATFKFDDSEFKKFKQIAVFAYRREAIGYMKDVYESWLESVALENLEYIPDGDVTEKKLKVLESKDSNIKFFTTLKFDAEMFKGALQNSPIYKKFGDSACVKNYQPVSAGRPPLPLTKENSHMIAVCGAGSGLAGNEEDGTLHMQRGVVKQIKTCEVRTNEDGSSCLVETESAATSLHIIDSEFNYYVLDGSAPEEDNEDE